MPGTATQFHNKYKALNSQQYRAVITPYGTEAVERLCTQKAKKNRLNLRHNYTRCTTTTKPRYAIKRMHQKQQQQEASEHVLGRINFDEKCIFQRSLEEKKRFIEASSGAYLME